MPCVVPRTVPRTVTLGEFLTEKQLQQVVDIINANLPYEERKRRFLEEVIRPNMDEINRKLGQENDPMYLTYMLLSISLM